jgi:tripartite-type tricarboxylate transporter receptor subunit TctC
LFKNLRFKFAKDLSPIALLAMAPTVLVVHPSLGVNSVQDLVKLGKESPDGIFYATAGKGTTTHLAGELFGQQAGIKMIPVPYKGSGETTKDLLAGNIKVMFSPAPPVLAFLKNGQLKGLASTGLSRAGVVPDLPTVAESGIKDFDMRMWFGLMAPAGTPPAIVEKLAKAAEKALQSPTVKDALAKQGFDAIYENPKDYAAFIQKEIDKWGRVVKTIGTIGN